MTLPHCPICNTLNVSVLYERLFDDRYGCPDIADVLRCGGCGHHFLTPLRADDQLGELYRKYYGRSGQSVAKLSSRRRSRFLRETLPGSRILGPGNGRSLLDVGCGPGEFLLKAQQEGFRAVGIDVDPEAINGARRLGLQAFVGSIFEWEQAEKCFDVITLNQVIEHVENPVKTLNVLRNSLKSGGVIFIATPNGNSALRQRVGQQWLHWHVPYHQHIFTFDSLRIAAQSAGLRVLTNTTRTPLTWLRLQQQHVREPLVRGTARWPWRGQPTVQRLKGSDVADQIVSIAHSGLSSIHDLRGSGDCIMATFRRA